MNRPPLRRGALAVVADTFADPDGRGRRVLVISDGSPDPENLPGHLLVSYEELPQLLAAIPSQDLLPLDDRACVTGDPRCCLLEPCPGCVLVLRAHLSAALAAGAILGPAGEAFVRSWNGARETARVGVRELAKQSRAFALQASSVQRPLAEAVAGRTVTAEQVQELLQEDQGEARAETTPEEANGSAEKADLSTTSPQPEEQGVEKKRVTSRRGSRRKEPSSDVAAPQPAPPGSDDATAGGALGAEAVAGPRGG